MTDTPNPNDLRHRLVEIDDELRALPANSFAEKHELNSEGDRLRDELRELLSTRLESMSDEWAGRAARKASHTVDYNEKAVMAAIRNPLESGS